MSNSPMQFYSVLPSSSQRLFRNSVCLTIVSEARILGLSEGCTTDGKTILIYSHLLYFVARSCGCKFTLPGRDVLSLTIQQKTNTPES